MLNFCRELENPFQQENFIYLHNKATNNHQNE